MDKESFYPNIAAVIKETITIKETTVAGYGTTGLYH